MSVLLYKMPTSELQDLLEKTHDEGQELFIFFSCTLDKHGDPRTKICLEAEDVLMEYTEFIRNTKRSLHLIYFRIMLEEYFIPGTEMNKDNRLRIITVPTLLKWKGYQRLVGRQCCKIPLLSMLFEQENQNKFPVYQPCNFFPLNERVVEVGEGKRKESGNIDNGEKYELINDKRTDQEVGGDATNTVVPRDPPNAEMTANPSQDSAGSKRIQEKLGSMPDQETPSIYQKNDPEQFSEAGPSGHGVIMEHKAQSP